MTTFEIPLVGELGAVAVLCAGRGAEPRPDPASLIPLLHIEPDHPPIPLAIVRQVHSNRCLTVERGDLPSAAAPNVMGEADALVTTGRGVALGVATADCVPLVALDPEAVVLAVVHAGWRGTLSGVLPAAIAAMRDRFGAHPGRILIGAGPSAGPCCYEVGSEVIESFTRERPAQAASIFSTISDGKALLDLVEANRLQAMGAGVDPCHFGSIGICTVCRPDLCHSYRRDGAAAGRMWTIAALRP